MIDPNKLDRARLDELLKIARTPVDRITPVPELERTCALINKLAIYMLEELDRELIEKEKRANRGKQPKPDPLTGRGYRNPYDDNTDTE